MRNELRSLVSVVALLLSSGCATDRFRVEPPSAARVAEVAHFSPVVPEEWKLSNGLTVLYLKDDELPLVRGRLFIRGGSLWGPDSPRGAVGAMGDQMRQGGAAGLSADSLDLQLEELAAAVTSSFSAEFGGVSFSCLQGDVDRVFEIFSDVALRPRFEGDRLSLWKGQAIEGIRRRKEDPSTVASIAFTQLVYGDTPYGRVTVERDVSSISREILVLLHKEFVQPEGALLVVTGRIERADAERLIEKHFGSWEARGSVLPPPPPVPNEPAPGIYFITLPFSQASVQMGQLGVPRLTPDYPAIDIFNEIFGSSGFGSRLMQKVRTELGLTYGVYGAISPGVVRGVNSIFLQTKADSVAPAIKESLAVLQGLQAEVPRREEMEEKKTALRNSYILNFDSLDEIAIRRARLKLLEYPADYDQTYLPKIGAVTPEDVRTVAQSRWDEGKFVVVVVGNEAAYKALESSLQKGDGWKIPFDLKKLRFESAIVIQ